MAVAYAESDDGDVDTLSQIKFRSGTVFDPDAVRVLLRCQPKAAIPKKQKELLLTELEPGMVVAKSIYNSNGMLLIPDGQELTEASIVKLKNHNRINPISQVLLVYC